MRKLFIALLFIMNILPVYAESSIIEEEAYYESEESSYDEAKSIDVACTVAVIFRGTNLIHMRFFAQTPPGSRVCVNGFRACRRHVRLFHPPGTVRCVQIRPRF